jgi:hypothetical protein
MIKLRITTNGENFRVEQQTSDWRGDLWWEPNGPQFPTKERAKKYKEDLEKASRRNVWVEVRD